MAASDVVTKLQEQQEKPLIPRHCGDLAPQIQRLEGMVQRKALVRAGSERSDGNHDTRAGAGSRLAVWDAPAATRQERDIAGLISSARHEAQALSI